jgi:hypothetical protein
MRIEAAVAVLQEHHALGQKVFIEFNGVNLYSDTVTLDAAYLAICGKTKAEYEKQKEEWREEQRKKDEEHKARIPALVEEWKLKGREILDEQYWAFWDGILPIRLGDLYKGMELGMSLEIVKALNDGCSLDDAESIMDNQGHSGMSYWLTVNMIANLCNRGSDFEAFVRRRNS